ncbi:MAG: hypothetical protein AAGD10_06765 [Myxococcota bacterium]
MKVRPHHRFVLGLLLTACGDGEDPVPSEPRRIGLELDLGWPPPSEGPDAGVDGGDPPRPDGGVTPGDLGPDAGVADVGMDFGEVDIPDSDGDRISDVHEGRGTIDTDGDGTTDELDLDSDQDGLPDIVEAGDERLTTPPVDTDRDRVPDYRDLDSDGDGIPDSVETADDFDADGFPNFRDVDSDGDGVEDRVEGMDDPDGDLVPNYLDADSDGDGIDDSVEGEADPDLDLIPAFLDLDSDSDGILDSVEGVDDVDLDDQPAFLDVDTDGDTVLDADEGVDDFDGDGVGNWRDTDADGDGIGDLFESSLDEDGDSQPNFLDLDADGDGIDDELESGVTDVEQAPRDIDADGLPDFLDVDSDADFILDAVEGLNDSDGDGLFDFVDLDSDADGLLDREEAGDEDLLTAPFQSDADGVPDYLDPDSDGDTISDLEEGRADSDQNGVPDRLQLDADGDGFSDLLEAGDGDLSTPPADTDGDSVADYRDADSDDDGLLDEEEPGCPAGSDRLLVDSDGDSFQDTAERGVGSDPCDAGSGIDAFYFVLPASGAQDSDVLVFDDTELDDADIVLNVDTTGSMGGEITNLRNSLSSIIVPGVQAVIPNPGFSVSTFQDFPIAPYGSSTDADEPFSLEQRVTTNTANVQTALNGLATKNGQDTRESGLEALGQIATGGGVTWSGGSVPAFNPIQNLVFGVADGTGGGVGLRRDALPIIVHVSDAPSHVAADYPSSISATSAQSVRQSLLDESLRVLTITGQNQPRPWSESRFRDRFGDWCQGLDQPTLAEIEGPQGTDPDWFELVGVGAGSTVQVTATAFDSGSALDPMVGIYDGVGNQLGMNDDRGPNDPDSSLSLVLSGVGPFYVAVSAFNDTDFNGSGAVSAGHYFLDVTVDGDDYAPSNLLCRSTDEGDRRFNATPWVLRSTATTSSNLVSCEDDCFTRVEDEELRVPYGIARTTGAQVPACAWDEFGSARPLGCAANECCTGLGGSGVPVDANGNCPLSFEISDNGSGIDQALVTGIEALANFSELEITTRVRPDPNELPSIDTSCFVQRVTPVLGTAPNGCAPAPVAVNGSTLTVGLDTFERVVPGATLEFEVVAANIAPNGQPCVPASQNFQVFRAFIDVVGDDVAQLSTRDVVIVVPPGQAPSGN